jgi:hypothetical protein
MFAAILTSEEPIVMRAGILLPYQKEAGTSTNTPQQCHHAINNGAYFLSYDFMLSMNLGGGR